MTRNNYLYARLRAGAVCSVCGAPAQVVHHLRPVALGGDDSPGNLQPLCELCHAAAHSVNGMTRSELTRAGIAAARRRPCTAMIDRRELLVRIMDEADGPLSAADVIDIICDCPARGWRVNE